MSLSSPGSVGSPRLQLCVPAHLPPMEEALGVLGCLPFPFGMIACSQICQHENKTAGTTNRRCYIPAGVNLPCTFGSPSRRSLFAPYLGALSSVTLHEHRVTSSTLAAVQAERRVWRILYVVPKIANITGYAFGTDATSSIVGRVSTGAKSKSEVATRGRPGGSVGCNA